MPAPLYLQIESEVARAHRALTRAASLSETLNTQTLCEDLFQLALECERLQLVLLRGAPRKRMTEDLHARPPASITQPESDPT